MQLQPFEVTPEALRSVKDQPSSISPSSIWGDEGSQSPKGSLDVSVGVDGIAIEMATEPFTTEEVEVPKATQGEVAVHRFRHSCHPQKKGRAPRLGRPKWWSPFLSPFLPPALL